MYSIEGQNILLLLPCLYLQVSIFFILFFYFFLTKNHYAPVSQSN